MAFDPRRTYLCYNNKDLIRDGFIPPFIRKEYIPPESFNINRAKNPPKGTSYKIVRDPNDYSKILSVTETKKLLPSNMLMLEIDFSKVMKSAVSYPFKPGASAFTPVMGIVAPFLLSPIGFGGIAEGITEMTYQLLDSETIINRMITITRNIKDTGIISFGGYPLSVFGIVKEVEERIAADGDNPATTRIVKGLDFTDEQLDVIGKYSDGAWQGTRRKRIAGATDSQGLYGSIGTPEVKFEDVAKDNQDQLFIKVVRDDRKLKFRGDNFEALTSRGSPFRLSGAIKLDATDKQIRIDTSDLKVGDRIYITYNNAIRRRIRQSLTHLGRIVQGNTIGIVGFRGAIKSESDVFDYQIKSWAVPNLPQGIKMSNIDDIDGVYTNDSEYKLSPARYVRMRRTEASSPPEYDRNADVDMIEGWRVGEAITNEVNTFWAADYRGILIYRYGIVGVVLNRKSIRDQVWFTNYLESLDFTIPTGINGTYTRSDLEQKIEDNIEWRDESGQLFDISEINNSLLFDREKIPYYRPFAKALRDVSSWVITDGNSGVGIINLDLYDRIDPGLQEDALFDLSYVEFGRTNSQPTLIAGCDEPADIFPHHYFSLSYDATTDAGGAGAWYDRDTVDNEILEWRPHGGQIESYWKQETPWFCGDFNRKTRVYTERMGGNSLDNFSWIYVNSVPAVPSTISLDMDEHRDNSIVLFNDEEFHKGLVYHKFSDVYFHTFLKSFNVNNLHNHIRDPYNYEEYRFRGYNRVMGDKPSFSNGKPITDDVRRICFFRQEKEFWWTEEVYNESTDMGFGLSFAQDDPELIIPSNWNIREMIIYYDWDTTVGKEITTSLLFNRNRDIAFYLEGSDTSIDNLTFKALPFTFGVIPVTGKDNVFKIDFAYYSGDKIKFYGQIWKYVRIKKIELRATSLSNPANINMLDLDDYKIKSGQGAIVNDGLGKILAFHANNNSGNIDVAVTYDDGREWVIHKGLIRLLFGETASLPVVVKSIDGYTIHLFYVLNDSFLMYKKFNSYDLELNDSVIEFKVPITYDVGDYNTSLDIPEIDYWGDFSKGGRNIRRSPSYFVAGDGESEYFLEQIRITNELRINNNSISDLDKRQTSRFIYDGAVSQMQDNFQGTAYAANIDGVGNVRIFITIDNKLSIKSSRDFRIWEYDIQDVEIHRNWVDPEVNKGEVIEIRNIQVLRNDFNKNTISIFYFHRDMLFVRHFSAALLEPVYDVNRNKVDAYLRNNLIVTPSSNNKPIFLVGKIPDQIRAKMIEEINKGVSLADSELFINHSYSSDEIRRFDDRFDVDMDTQVFGNVDSTGLTRVLYKDKLGLLNALSLDALGIGLPEVWYDSKEKI